MHKTPEDRLVFDKGDCTALCSILSMYFRAHQLTADEFAEVRSVWEQAHDLTLLDDRDTYESLARRVFLFSGRPTVLEEGQTTVETSANALFTRIIGWAGVNLAEGTVTVEEATQRLLATDYEDPGIRQVFEEVDREYATVYHPQTLIAAGATAQAWTIQLAE
jgi:hypothetical protein